MSLAFVSISKISDNYSRSIHPNELLACRTHKLLRGRTYFMTYSREQSGQHQMPASGVVFRNLTYIRLDSPLWAAHLACLCCFLESVLREETSDMKDAPGLGGQSCWSGLGRVLTFRSLKRYCAGWVEAVEAVLKPVVLQRFGVGFENTLLAVIRLTWA
jgi:hypothetical protein